MIQKGLPVSGRKSELIERLKNGVPPGPKPKAWQHSEAKKQLKRDLLDPKSPIHGMSVEAIRNSDTRYQQYPNFAKYYKDLRKQVEEEKKQVRFDDVRAREFRKNFPRNRLNERGYPHWDTHPAKQLLEKDVANKLHEKMKPCHLREKRGAYMDFPADVFAKRVYAEIDKQRAARFWAYKRNNARMKKYVKRIELMK